MTLLDEKGREGEGREKDKAGNRKEQRERTERVENREEFMGKERIWKGEGR